MNTTITAIGAGVALFLMVQPVVNSVKSLVGVDDRRMYLVEMRYEDGVIRQHLGVVGAPFIQANWVVRVTRGSKYLCGDGGSGTYTGEPSPEMTVDVWAGDDCPPLEPGDVAQASWEWATNSHQRLGILARMTIGEDQTALVK